LVSAIPWFRDFFTTTCYYVLKKGKGWTEQEF
jgi:hypothetical protein